MLPCWRRVVLLKDIAQKLYISHATIRWHLENLRGAFNVHSTREILLKVDAHASAIPQAVRFTPRGKEVMELFMRGCTYKEIAERLGISRSGVYRHREKMLLQNNCESMMKLVARYQARLAEKNRKTPDKPTNKKDEV